MRRALIALALAACGDSSTPGAPKFEPHSGTRLKLEQYLYEDGTRQVDPAAFYDTGLHTRCALGAWPGDVKRCVPIAAQAIYVDATCSEIVGVGAASPGEPTHFIGYDRVGFEVVATRLYSAGPGRAEPVLSYYERRDDACVGPFSAPFDASFFDVTELPASAMAALYESELGAARLGLQRLTSDDGLQVAVGLRDRALDRPCTPTLRGDGVACEPAQPALTGSLFADAACSAPVIVADPANVPPLARVVEPSGCAAYFAVGAEVPLPLYRRDGDTCTRLPQNPDLHGFGLADRIELPWLERSVGAEEGPGVPIAVTDDARRLHRVTLADLDDPALRFEGERLVDTETREECRLEMYGDAIRCMPAAIAATMLYTTGCTVPVFVAESAERTCTAAKFASHAVPDGIGTVWRAIGDRATEPLFHFNTDGICEAYPATPGRVVRNVGPPIAPEMFLGAVRYGER